MWMPEEEMLWCEIRNMLYYPNLHGVDPYRKLDRSDMKRLYEKFCRLEELVKKKGEGK